MSNDYPNKKNFSSKHSFDSDSRKWPRIEKKARHDNRRDDDAGHNANNSMVINFNQKLHPGRDNSNDGRQIMDNNRGASADAVDVSGHSQNKNMGSRNNTGSNGWCHYGDNGQQQDNNNGNQVNINNSDCIPSWRSASVDRDGIRWYGPSGTSNNNNNTATSGYDGRYGNQIRHSHGGFNYNKNTNDHGGPNSTNSSSNRGNNFFRGNDGVDGSCGPRHGPIMGRSNNTVISRRDGRDDGQPIRPSGNNFNDDNHVNVAGSNASSNDVNFRGRDGGDRSAARSFPGEKGSAAGDGCDDGQQILPNGNNNNDKDHFNNATMACGEAPQLPTPVSDEERLLLAQLPPEFSICKNLLELVVDAPPTGWEEKKKRAAQAVLDEFVKNNNYEDEEDASENDDDDSGGDSSVDDLQPKTSFIPSDRARDDKYSKFLEALTKCLPLTMGFHTPPGTEWCFCPCHKKMKQWQESEGFGVSSNYELACSSGKGKGIFEVAAFIKHLEDLSKNDVYHLLILKYLKELYKNYHESSLFHRAFYNKDGKDYKKAVGLESHRKLLAMQKLSDAVAKLEERNKQLSQELENLKKVSPDQAKKKEIEMKLKEKFLLAGNNNNNVETTVCTLPVVRLDYNAYWKNCHTLLGMNMKTRMPVQNIVFEVEEPIDLQQLFDHWYEHEHYSFLFCNTESDFKKGQTNAKRMLLLSTVELTGDKELGNDVEEEFEEEHTGVDAGGVAREFFSQVWRQMGRLAVTFGGGKNSIKLFYDESEAGCIPASNDLLESKLHKLRKNEKAAIEKKIKAYYQAIGRLMTHWIATDPAVSCKPFVNPSGEQFGHTIDVTAMPALYRNVLLRGTTPTDPWYPLEGLVDHVLQLLDQPESRAKDSQEKQEALKKMLDLDGDKNSNEEELRKFAHENWIEGRSIAIQAMREGLTLGGFFDLSIVFRPAPLGIMDQMVFSKADVSVADVLAAIDAGVPASPDNMPDEWVVDQLSLISGLKQIMIDRSTDEYKSKHPDKANFLGQFINFCTGLWTIPGSYHGDFKIQIEFQEDLNNTALPVAHTCVNVIGFPARAYNGCRQTLELKLDQSIAFSLGRFSMQ